MSRKKSTTKKRRRSGLMYLDPDRLESHQGRIGLCITAWALKADVARNTVYRALKGDGLHVRNAKAIADALNVNVEVLRSRSGDDDSTEESYGLPAHPEWEVVKGSLGRWTETSNGLQFRRCKMRHKHLSDGGDGPVLGRGRFYDLLAVPHPDRERMTEQLTRHAMVCRKLTDHPSFSINLSVCPVAGGDGWWIVDGWVDGVSLAERLENGPLETEELRVVSGRIAAALQALHKARIVFRELAPSRVLLAKDGEVYLTDLELAKLLGHGKTVSADWPVDPYRAPEVEEGDATPRADLFSWGRIFVHASSGVFPDTSRDPTEIRGAELPIGVRRIVERCLSPLRSKRPRSAAELIAAVERWK